MLDVLIHALTAIQKEADTFDLQFNWCKTKILQASNSSSCSTVRVAEDKLKSAIHISIRGYDWLLWCQQRWGPAKDKHCLDLYEFAGKMDLEVQYPAGIQLDTKIGLYKTYKTYVVSALMYGCETWARTRHLCAQIDTFHTCARLRFWWFIFSLYTEHRSQSVPAW